MYNNAYIKPACLIQTGRGGRIVYMTIEEQRKFLFREQQRCACEMYMEPRTLTGNRLLSNIRGTMVTIILSGCSQIYMYMLNMVILR